jgi:hypothetical protein
MLPADRFLTLIIPNPYIFVLKVLVRCITSKVSGGLYMGTYTKAGKCFDLFHLNLLNLYSIVKLSKNIIIRLFLKIRKPVK